MSQEEACILYCHHKNDEVTRFHYSRFVSLNPNCLVIPVYDSTRPIRGCLEGAIDLASIPYAKWTTLTKKIVWEQADAFLYKACRMGLIKSERCIYVEWDCFSNQSAKDFYKDSWNADFASSNIFSRQKKPSWYWFKFKKGYIGGVPLCATIMKTSFLQQATSQYYSKKFTSSNLFCEMRLPMLFEKANAKIEQISNPMARKTMGSSLYDPIKIPLQGPSWFHKIKTKVEE